MKLKFFISVLALSSFSAFAEVDYSKCNSNFGMMAQRLNNDGQLELGFHQKIKNKSSEGNVEKYVIENDFGSIGFGGIGGGKSEIEITLVRDDQGRVIKMIHGPDKLDKKTIDSFKKFSLQSQVSNAVMGANIANGYGAPMTAMEPFYNVKDKSGKFQYKPLTKLTKEERSQVGVTEDLYKEMSKNVKRDKKSITKIEKGLKELQSKDPGSYYLGSETEFEINDGVCSPKSVSNRMYDAKNGTVQSTQVFNKEACDEVAKLMIKHKEQITKCDQSTKEIQQDIWSNSDKLKSLSFATMGYGYGGGMIGYGMMGGGMMGNQSQLTSLKNYCDFMLGEVKFGFGGGMQIPKDKKASDQ